ncbi:MAG: phosphatidate cytidylyltransferase, partial [Pseudomonadota bacterium]
MLKQRVITALVAVAILLVVLFYAPQPVAQIIIGALIAAAAWEWSQFLGRSSRFIRWLFVAVIVACEALLAAILVGTDASLPVLYAGLVWWFAALVWTFFFPTPVPIAAAWIGGLMMLLPAYVA